MKGKYVFLLVCLCLINLLFFDLVHPQLKGGGHFFLSGIISEMSWDRNSIVVNGRKFILTSETEIVDQKGNKLPKEGLKTNIEIAIEASSDPNGFLLKKIVIIKDRGV